jgi:hypothetical protein
MSSASPGVSTRLRHYITLATQSVPLIGLLGMIGRDFHALQLLILMPLAVTAAGPILELSGRRWGRFVTLGGFSLQIAGMLLVIGIVLSMGSTQYIRWSDLALLALFVPPAVLLVWNWRAGRPSAPPPETPA